MPYMETALVDREGQPEKSGLPKMAAMSGVMSRRRSDVIDGAERGADDDRHREIDDVAPQDEIAGSP